MNKTYTVLKEHKQLALVGIRKKPDRDRPDGHTAIRLYNAGPSHCIVLHAWVEFAHNGDLRKMPLIESPAFVAPGTYWSGLDGERWNEVADRSNGPVSFRSMLENSSQVPRLVLWLLAGEHSASFSVHIRGLSEFRGSDDPTLGAFDIAGDVQVYLPYGIEQEDGTVMMEAGE